MSAADVRALHFPRTWMARGQGCPHGFGVDEHEESCFERVTTCNGCGTDHPCSTIKALDKGQDRVGEMGAEEFTPRRDAGVVRREGEPLPGEKPPPTDAPPPPVVHPDGRIEYPHGRPSWFAITPELFESLAMDLNEARQWENAYDQALDELKDLRVVLAQQDKEIERLRELDDDAREEAAWQWQLEHTSAMDAENPSSCCSAHAYKNERDDARRVIAAVEELAEAWDKSGAGTYAAVLRAALAGDQP